MSVQLIFGLLLNTIAFGVMGLNRQQLGIKLPQYFHNGVLQLMVTMVYYASFLIILFSTESLFLKIVISLLMQFVINHIVWGLIMGSVAGLFFKKPAKEAIIMTSSGITPISHDKLCQFKIRVVSQWPLAGRNSCSSFNEP